VRPFNTSLKQFGEYVAPNRTLGSDQLRAMRGSTAVDECGMQLEYFPLSIRGLQQQQEARAFISLGGQFSYYNAKALSTLGPLGTPLTTFPKYLTPRRASLRFSTETGTVWSIVSSVGTRYKLSPLRDLMIDLRFQYYFQTG
jgi:hypothetical protein